MRPLQTDAMFDVSRETIHQLANYEALVKKWNLKINLISKQSVEHIFQRHIVDSIQLFKLANPNFNVWCDLGSGGGFPGMVIALLAREKCPGAKVILVESDQRKCVFLREAARLLHLDVEIKNQRIEDLASLGADVLSARALAPLVKLCEFADLHLGDCGRAIFPKGSNHRAEIDDARKSWMFDITSHPSFTDPDAAILVLGNIRHV